MPKGKKAKKRIKKIFTKGSKARKQIRKALKDDKVSKKEMKRIRAAGATKKQLQKVRKRADKSKALKIGKKVDQKKEVKKLVKNNPRGRQPENSVPSSNSSPTKGSTYANNKPTGSGNKNKGNKNKIKINKGETPTLADNVDTTRNRNLFDRGMTVLDKKADTYQSTFDSKKNLKKLRKSALERMSIDPSKYGREEGKKTLASRYDKNSDKLLNKLKAPLTNFLEKDSGSELNMFSKKGNIRFSEEKMAKFVDGDTDLVADIKSAAGALGYTAPKNPLERATAALGRINTPYTKDTGLKSRLLKKPKMV